ncbi:hypothetical protein EGW08_007714 [Elysia chlorotica]|uniref:Major facilitator superfamily (MFS) profile domain-containing protein n=1 Tax=Elysia chlorotica TaxID=188477 RepID=A0A433TSJ5_ELYCH|nr:hypothetical protein EGW08_007714 [Elysia chlorotica]
MRSDGIFFLQFLDRFNQNKQLTAWPGAVSFTLQCLVAPAATAFCNRFSVRTAVHLGTFLLTSGLVMSAFSPNIYFLFLSYGVVQGIGRGLIIVPGIFIVNMYFSKRLGIALGFASSGTGIGTLGLPPLITWLFDTLGYQGAHLTVAGIATCGWVVAMLFRPLSMHKNIVRHRMLKAKIASRTCQTPDVEYRIQSNCYSRYGTIKSAQSDTPNLTSTSGYCTETENESSLNHTISIKTTSHQTKNTPDGLYNAIAKIEDTRLRRKRRNCCVAVIDNIFPIEEEKRGEKGKRILLHWPLFRDFPFLVLCVSMAFFNLAQKTVFTFLPAYARQRGIAGGSLVLSAAGAGDTVGRVVAGLVLDRAAVKPHKGAVYALVLIFAAAAAWAVPFSYSLLPLCAAGCVYGFSVGASVSQKSNVLATLLGKETVNSAFGILYAFQGIGTMAGLPISGALRDAFGNYDFAFYLSSGSMYSAGALVALSVLLFAMRRRRREGGAGRHGYETLPTGGGSGK